MPDKYKAIWLSHSSYENYIKCPRLYYLANIYKDPKTKNKITVNNPYIALGVAIHNVLEPLANMPSEERKTIDLIFNYNKEFDFWRAVNGDYTNAKGAWKDEIEEKDFYERGLKMIESVCINFQKGICIENKIDMNVNKRYILLEKSIRPSLYYKGDMIPNISISDKENIILCGSIDWIVYSPSLGEGAGGWDVTVLDFKTGRNEESDDSNQLLIYKKLFESLQNKWKVNQYAYYYLDKNEVIYKSWSEEEVNKRVEQMLNNFIKVGIEIRDKRYDILWSKDKKYIEKYFIKDNFENNFKCHNGNAGCRNCLPFEKVLRREAKYVGVSLYGQDMYIV